MIVMIVMMRMEVEEIVIHHGGAVGGEGAFHSRSPSP